MTVKEYHTAPAEEKKNPWVQTPLRESYALSEAAGCRIFLKLENLQPSGSFKTRGIGYYILRRLEELPLGSRPHIFASSGGNAGLAAVHSARALGLQCTVVVPTATSALMVAKLRAAGAHDVIQHGAAWKDADTYLRTEVMPRAPQPTIYCPPFDHPDIWAGNSTVMHEIAAQLDSPPDVLICSVGGGGLMNGICQAMDDLKMYTPTILALETAGAESLNAALHARELITLPKITSQATSLGCAKVTEATFKYAQRANVRSVVLPDAEAAMGCWRLADDERMMVELACGVNVALCYDGRLEKALGRPVRRDDVVVIVLCGGSNVTSDMLCGWRKEYAYVEEELDMQGKRDSGYGIVPKPGSHLQETPCKDQAVVQAVARAHHEFAVPLCEHAARLEDICVTREREQESETDRRLVAPVFDEELLGVRECGEIGQSEEREQDGEEGCC
ncbi:tryptophan synthase beta subunit-like PLP-dependent enzyme [Dothidotthia symphoricarpi CBS 119687]|uniref:L-serine ammonia-lyase n=1 Tax=Dothidotthia symphoricarpi CBS 119687 TaxID=1392245 RepID=A0A6A6APW0_9PLEO|nr:tryptophan synthase beta subunit-like PLP-dependent enzyme [Dothidotthia symphoricarpi CBS 119687]KAF2133959.1 tryptophan synthase beta subunit-like PLP-dependent enzyme [Dothidotthia symphoricarpi CBS 119687]